MAYTMGQYRSMPEGSVNNYDKTLGYKNIFLGEDTTSTSFKDVVIIPEKQFAIKQDYYLFISIPRDMNYNMTFNIKLLKGDESSSEEYQFLKQISVSRGGDSSNVHDVVLYETNTGGLKAMLPLPYPSNNRFVRDELYVRNEQDKQAYYLGVNNTSAVRTDKYNKVAVIASWKQEYSDDYGVFELVFRPIEEGFTQIILEMVRSVEDYNIQRTTASGQEYGRVVDISKVECRLMTLNNIVNELVSKDQELSRIGVWGHPGLLMCINGEEIRIGPSGYYELGSIPIESLGIVAQGNENNYTIDYQYQVKEEEGE